MQYSHCIYAEFNRVSALFSHRYVNLRLHPVLLIRLVTQSTRQATFHDMQLYIKLSTIRWNCGESVITYARVEEMGLNS